MVIGVRRYDKEAAEKSDDGISKWAAQSRDLAADCIDHRACGLVFARDALQHRLWESVAYCFVCQPFSHPRTESPFFIAQPRECRVIKLVNHSVNTPMVMVPGYSVVDKSIRQYVLSMVFCFASKIAVSR